ncbi:MAG: DUF927 domain-containing protein [Cyanobacteria bacterium REEB67]|nr:DUF927 domain-containing protein [Cyanobacteria bacterium REEB67]
MSLPQTSQHTSFPQNEPETRKVNIFGIPQYLRDLNQWVNWKWEIDKGKWVKVPKQPNGRNALSNNPSTWSGFDAVAATYNNGGMSGIGFCHAEGDGIQSIDLDHCVDESGNLKTWGRDIVAAFEGAYIERSPRDGLHIIVKAKPFEHGLARSTKWADPTNAEDVKNGIEIFDSNSPRYLTITGDVYQHGEIKDYQQAVDWLCSCTKDPRLGSTRAEKPLSPIAPPDITALALRAVSLEEEATRLLDAAKVMKPTREEWVGYCFALKSAGHSFELFHELCKIWPDYDGEDDCRRLWTTAKPHGNVTVSTLFYDAKQLGWDVPLPTIVEDRWQETKAPNGFKLTGEGLMVYRASSKTPYWDLVCDPIAVTARTSGINGTANGGLIVEILTLDGYIKELPIARVRLHQDGRELAQELAGFNFRIEPGKESDLLKFLGRSIPEVEVIAVNHTGWAISNGQEKLVFVFPGEATDRSYRYQPEHASGLHNVMQKAGSLEDWNREVLAPVENNRYCVYEICKSLSAPLYKFASLDAGGEHLVGRTTSGKTTLAQLGASVWGCGADPSQNPAKSYIRKWNNTANGLEGLLSQYNDLPAYLDELGSYNGKDFDTLIYNATSGMGKGAMTSRREMRQTRTWQTIITSTGEVSILHRIEDIGPGRKRAAKGGQVARFIDREILPSTFSGAHQVDALKRACARNYGVLGPAFVEKLVSNYSVTTLTATVQERLDASMNRLLASRAKFNDVQRRALRRFALSEVAGSLLVEFQLVPGLTIEAVRLAIDTVVLDWEPSSRMLSDEERAVRALRDFIITNRDTKFKTRVVISPTFEHENESADKIHRDWCGVVDTKTDPDNPVVFVFPSAIEEATGIDAEAVAKELDRRGLLVREKPNRMQSRVRMDGQRPYCYAIKLSFVEGSTEEPTADPFAGWAI